jgi:CarboxypepD_reg-like domain/Secretin and TonB N terminus short domain
MKKRYQISLVYAFMVSLFLFMSCPSFSQLPETKINLNVHDTPIIKVLENISSQTGYLFTYDASLVLPNKKVSFVIDNLDIETALDSLFQDSSLSFKLVDRNIVIYRDDRKKTSLMSEEAKQKKYEVFQGIIIDKKTKKPLPYANIGINGANLGTISNLEGRFQLQIPKKYSDSLIYISYIGYENLSARLPENTKGPVLIELEKTTISLQEVIIRYQDPNYLLNETLKKINENYLSEYSTMTAYFREYVKKNKKYLVFSEAVIEIAKEPYQISPISDQVKLLKGRNIIAGTAEDSVIMKIKSGIANSIQLDVIKSRPDFLSYDFSKHYDIYFSDIVNFNDQLVYELNFSPKVGDIESIYRGKLYIEQTNLVLLAADFHIDPLHLKQGQDMFIVKKSRGLKAKTLSAEYHVEYKETDGKYHLSQAHGEVNFHFRKRKEWLGSNYSLTIELAVTDILLNKRTRYKPGEIYRPNEILSDQTFEYDPQFWGDYNIIEPEKSLQEVIERVKSKMLVSGGE